MALSKIKFVFFDGGDVGEAAKAALARHGLVPAASSEVAILVSYGKIIPRSTIDSFKYGILNIHPSLLPALRGPSPIKSAILENLEKTGVSIMLLDNKIDHGPILAQAEIALSPRLATSNELRDALVEKGAELLAKILPQYLAGQLKPIPQDHAKATYCKKFTADDAFVPYPFDDTGKADRIVRALNPEPGAWTVGQFKTQNAKRKDLRLKILSGKIEGGKFVPILVQPAGKRPMPWPAFLRGHPLTI